jgi:hypothetical protein
MPTIPQDYLAVLAVIITFFSHRMRTDRLSNEQNSLIAGAAIVVIVILTAWMTTGFTSDLRTNILLCCSIGLSLVSVIKELLDLLDYQAQSSSPLAPEPPRMPPAH